MAERNVLRPDGSYSAPACAHALSQFQELLVDISKTLRNPHGTEDYYSFRKTLVALYEYCYDFQFPEPQRILRNMMIRGDSVCYQASDARTALGVFQILLPRARGVAREQLAKDQKTLRDLQKAQGTHHMPASGGRFSTPGYMPATPAAFGGPAYGGGPAAAAWGPAPGAVILPLPGAPRAAGGGKRGKGKARGGGGAPQPQHAPPQQHLSNRAQTAIGNFNKALQDAQQELLPVPNATPCGVCAAANRNPHQDNLNCAFFICRRCKRGGHRANKCPY